MHNCLPVAAILVLPVVCASLSLPTGKVKPSNIVEGAYLIQLSSDSALLGRDSQGSYVSAHEAFHKRAESSDLNCR